MNEANTVFHRIIVSLLNGIEGPLNKAMLAHNFILECILRKAEVSRRILLRHINGLSWLKEEVPLIKPPQLRLKMRLFR